MKLSYIYSLSVKEIIENCSCKDDKKFVVDLNDRFVYASVVQSLDTYPDCAFFYQLKKAIEENKQALAKKPPFEQALLYLDFGNIFTTIIEKDDSKTKEKIEKQREIQNYIENKLFESGNEENRGLFIKFPNCEEEVRFIPFDKSNSMTRNCQMSFLRAEFKEEMNNRLMLDMKINSVVLSKLYAYRGLYLTGSKRIDEKEEVFELNENTVVVIKDDNTLLNVPKETTILTAKKAEINKEEVEYTKQTAEKYTKWDTCNLEFEKDESGAEIRKIELNRFDGQGFISPEYAMYINDILLEPVDMDGNKVSFCGLWNSETDNRDEIPNKYKDKMVYSMQIRLPFGKGVLHTFPFYSLIKEKLELDDKDIEEIQIKDVFGKYRNLKEAKIILTESMFKCKHWLEDFCKTVKEKEQIAEDPMAYYFKRFKKYNHALYIANVDTMLPTGKITSLNYQFLNPMALDKKQLNSLVEEHYKYCDKLEKNKLLQKNNLLNDQNDIDSEYADEAFLLSNQESWVDVLKHTTKAVYDKKVAGMLNGMRESRIRDILFGRFAVKGECRFLARDLMAMVAHLVNQCRIDEKPLDEEQIQNFTKLALYGEKIYLPNANIELVDDQEVVLLRNPHLSRNEEWICRYCPQKERKKYIGHLKGIVEIGYYSMANMSLGGADFDGDLVRIVADTNVVNRVKANCYENEEELKRKIAVIEIPSTGKPTSDTINGNYTMQYKAIKNTFSSRVGQISNATVRIGRWEYYDHYEKYDEEDEEKNTPIKIKNIENKCAEATILTGLEIDSCKNGEKPDISPVVSFKRIPENTQDKVTGDEKTASESKDNEIKDDGIDYLKTKNKISNMFLYNKFGIKIDKFTDKQDKKNYYTITSKTNSVKIPEDDAKMPTLDKLPRLFAEKKYSDK